MPAKLHTRLLLASTYVLVVFWFLSERLPGGGMLSAAVFNGAGLAAGTAQTQSEIAGSGIHTTDANIGTRIAAAIALMLPYIGVGALVAFVIAGIFLILGFGNDTSIQRAKKIMIWSAAGLALIALSVPILSLIVAP